MVEYNKLLAANEIDFLGLRLHNLSMSETIKQVEECIGQRKPVQHVVINAAKVVHSQNDINLRKIINTCEIINADGQAIVWAARFLGYDFKERVSGVDLMYRLLDESVKNKWSVYFLGAKQEVLDALLLNVKNDYNSEIIAGADNGYFSEEQEDALAIKIKAAKADILFVGISSPKKENFLNRNLDKMQVPFVMGVGGSFDILAGYTKRAPSFFQRKGLEWLYRIYQEPGRMWKRYATTNPVFIYLVIKEKLKKKLKRHENTA